MAGSLRDQLTENLETLDKKKQRAPGQATTGASTGAAAAEVHGLCRSFKARKDRRPRSR
jgi:hypothetical protein